MATKNERGAAEGEGSHSLDARSRKISAKMKLPSILVVFFTFVYGTSGGTIPQFDPESPEFQSALKVFQPLALSKRLHMSMDSEMLCENYRPGANLMVELDVDGENEFRLDIPPQVSRAVQVQCQALRMINEVKPMSMKIKVNIVERDSGSVIMRNEVRISNGAGALAPFSTFTMAVLLLALLSKSY